MRMAQPEGKQHYETLRTCNLRASLSVNSADSWLAGNRPADMMRVIDSPREICRSEPGLEFRYADNGRNQEVPIQETQGGLAS
jgi:hypothetical protein